MFCQLAFSAQSFERLIKYRVADLFRPLSAPVPFPQNQQSWLDGMLVTHIDFNRVENDRFVVVNERGANGAISPNANGYGYNAGALALELTVDFHFASVQAVAAAGMGQPVVQTVSVPAGLLHLTVRASVGTDGVPMLQMELDVARLTSLGLPAPVIASISSAATASFPFDIGDLLKSIFPPGNDKVLNAGITRDDSGAVVLRFEFPGQVSQSALAHAQNWQTFFSADFRANLGNDDWCMDLDGGAVAAGLGEVVNPSFKNDKPLRFDSQWDSGFIDDDTPRIVITKRGRVESACGGNDIRFDAFANLDLSVPSDNLLQATLSFDIDKDDWDVIKCLGLTMLNPLSVFITAVDNGQLGVGILERAVSFVVPTRAVIVTSAIALLFLGVDKLVAKSVIDTQLKEDPKVTRLAGGGFAFDQVLSPRSALTNNWLVLKKCTGFNGRMLLTGEFRVPDAVLPRLTASDLEGLSKWTLEDRCQPGKGQVSDGAVTLSVAPGHGASAASVQPVKAPTISLKWGVRPDGGDLVFEVLNDSLGIYQDPGSEYRQVSVPGIPGVVEVELKSSTVRKKAFSDFATAPYALRLRFYTNGGVREYQFEAPPVLQDFVETTAQAFERINNCMHRGTDLLLHKYLQLKWLIDPPSERGSIAQQWEVHVRGLEPGRKATVWHQETGTPLVRAFADHTGRVDVSLVLGKGQHARALLIGLDDEPFLGAEQMRRLAETRGHDVSIAPAEVAIRETLLTEIEHLDFDDTIDTLSLGHVGSYSTLAAQTVRGHRFAYTIPSPYNPGLATPAPDTTVTAAEEGQAHQGQLVWRGGERQFTILSRRQGRTEALAEYSARSSYDLGASREDLFAQVSADGRRITLFQKSVPILLSSHEWREPARATGDDPIAYDDSKAC